MAIGTRLREWRVARGLSQAQLAGELQITQGTLSRIETGSALPDLLVALRVARMTKQLLPVEAWEKSARSKVA